MEGLAPVIIGSTAAVFLVFLVHRTVRKRRKERGHALAGRRRVVEIAFMIIGLLLMVSSFIAARSLLRVREPPRGQLFPAGIGIASQVSPRPNRGFTAGMGVRFADCDGPVDVTIAFVGSAEYFEDNKASLTRGTELTLAMPSRELSKISVGYGGGGYYDALNPLEATLAEELPEGTLTMNAPQVRGMITIANGEMADWSSHLASIVVRFKADWLIPRGLKTCYLRLPALAGNDTVLGAQAGLGRAARSASDLIDRYPRAKTFINNTTETLFAPYNRALAIHRGVSVVEPGENEVLESQPVTNSVTGGSSAIVCSSSSPRTGRLGDLDADLVSTRSSPNLAIRDGAFGEAAAELDCSALVTLAEADAGSNRDLVLLLAAAFFSLGAAVSLEIVLDIQRQSFQHSASAASASPHD